MTAQSVRGDPVDVAAAVPVLRTLANPARLRIAWALLDGERSVADIEASLGLRQPNLSQHLAELRDIGVVASRREVKSVFYRLAGEPQRRLVAALLYGFGGGGEHLPSASVQAAPAPRRRPLEAAAFAVVAMDTRLADGAGPG